MPFYFASFYPLCQPCYCRCLSFSHSFMSWGWESTYTEIQTISYGNIMSVLTSSQEMIWQCDTQSYYAYISGAYRRGRYTQFALRWALRHTFASFRYVCCIARCGPREVARTTAVKRTAFGRKTTLVIRTNDTKNGNDDATKWRQEERVKSIFTWEVETHQMDLYWIKHEVFNHSQLICSDLFGQWPYEENYAISFIKLVLLRTNVDALQIIITNLNMYLLILCSKFCPPISFPISEFYTNILFFKVWK